MSEIQMAAVPQSSMEVPEVEESPNAEILPGSRIEGTAAGELNIHGASSTRSRVQLTATLLALFVCSPLLVWYLDCLDLLTVSIRSSRSFLPL